MRAYKFLNAEFGLKCLYERRLKQSRVSDLNDPFELTPYRLTDIAVRKTFYKTREDVGNEKGLVCFSKDWHNPVIWAHYSDKHKGLCLGFEIPEIKGYPENDEADHVTYITELMPFPPNFEEMPDSEHTAFARSAIFKKFKDWSYEKEIRVWGSLKNEENDTYFVPFGENMRLTEVIIGQKCPFSKAAIVRALGYLAGEVKISKARAAYDKFEMVEDEQGP